MNESFFLMIDDPSRLAESRRIAMRVAAREGMAPDAASNAAIVASELASNLWKHAQHGGLHIAPLSGHGEPGIEILSVDRVVSARPSSVAGSLESTKRSESLSRSVQYANEQDQSARSRPESRLVEANTESVPGSLA